MTPAERLRLATEDLKERARVYDRESHGGERPLEAGFRLRVSAKEFAQAERDASAKET